MNKQNPHQTKLYYWLLCKFVKNCKNRTRSTVFPLLLHCGAASAVAITIYTATFCACVSHQCANIYKQTLHTGYPPMNEWDRAENFGESVHTSPLAPLCSSKRKNYTVSATERTQRTEQSSCGLAYDVQYNAFVFDSDENYYSRRAMFTSSCIEKHLRDLGVCMLSHIKNKPIGSELFPYQTVFMIVKW